MYTWPAQQPFVALLSGLACRLRCMACMNDWSDHGALRKAPGPRLIEKRRSCT
jgi:hypothetical protein